MHRFDTNAWLALLAVLATACSATRSVRPLGAQRVGAALSVGGPLFTNLGPPLPVPIAVASARYGLTDRTDVDAGVLLPVVHTLGFDMGAATQLWGEHRLRPLMMAGGRVMLVGPVPPVAWPHVLLTGSATASWTLMERVVGYLGTDVTWNTHGSRVHPTLLGGASWTTPLGGLSFSAEARWLAISTPSDTLSVRYSTIASRGAVGCVLAVAYRFSARRPDHGP